MIPYIRIYLRIVVAVIIVLHESDAYAGKSARKIYVKTVKRNSIINTYSVRTRLEIDEFGRSKTKIDYKSFSAYHYRTQCARRVHVVLSSRPRIYPSGGFTKSPESPLTLRGVRETRWAVLHVRARIWIIVFSANYEREGNSIEK